jgi:cytochrome b6-f complex iron-sulfur subunit
MSPLLLLLATSAGLLAVAFWWFRPIAREIAIEMGSTTQRTKPVPPGLADPDCGIGTLLMAAAANGPGAGGGAGTKPKRKTPTGPDRRAFLRNSWMLSMGAVLSAFGAASIGFLWPRLGGGFGSVIELGTEEELLDMIADGNGHAEFPAGRLYLVQYDASQDPDGQYAEITNGASVMAIYQACVHLGCRVPWCNSSRWFECPCHGSRYNRWGEYEFGPAPRGLDRFPVELVDGVVNVDTSTVVLGPSVTGGALTEPQAGPNCG